MKGPLMQNLQTRHSRFLAARRIGVWCFLLVIVAASTGLPAAPPADSPAAPAATFADMAKQAGLDAILNSAYAHASAWGDANGDGYPDLFWGSFGAEEGPDRLLINQKDGTFKESVQKSITRDDGRASGAVFVDLDNDGALDLIVVNNWRKNAPCGNELLHNDGKGNFTDVTAGSGMDLAEFSGRNPFILDYDGDGRLDVLVQNDMFGGKGNKRSYLLHNEGHMKFTDVTAKAGLPTADNDLLGLGGAVGDVNGDGRPDFLNVGSQRQGRLMPPDIRLYLANAKGTFRLSKAFDFNATFPNFNNGEDWVCGAAIGDLNGDGRMDLVIGVHYGSSVENGKAQAVSVRAYLNMGNDPAGNPLWKDITEASGLKALFVKQPHVEIQDFNNDGRMDIWNGTAMKQKQGGQFMPYIQYNTGNDAAGIPHFSPPPGLGEATTFEGHTPDHKALINPRYFAASPTADFDLDGRLDIFGADWSTPKANNHSYLFHNTTQPMGNYLDVKVDQGAGAANRFGIGAKVSVYRAGQAGDAKALLGTQLIEINNGYCSGRTATVHFGVPGCDKVDVVVQLPNAGPALKAPNVATKQVLTVSK